jgi:putative sterol carrier protein
MPYAFLSDEWFNKVEELVAAAGDLQIPPAMKVVEVNVTVTGSPIAASGAAAGEVRLAMKEGLFSRGHRPDFATTLTLSADLARKIFIDGDTAAGVQAFLDGSIKVDGDLAKLVAMQTVEPSEPQRRLTRQIAAITQ